MQGLTLRGRTNLDAIGAPSLDAMPQSSSDDLGLTGLRSRLGCHVPNAAQTLFSASRSPRLAPKSLLT